MTHMTTRHPAPVVMVQFPPAAGRSTLEGDGGASESGSLSSATAAQAAHIGFMHDNEPPRDWIDELRTYSPKSDEQGWLALVWEPGDPWIPGQRWALYEMLHEQFVDPEIMDELQGPHPRSEGHMCSDKVPAQFQCLCRRKKEEWVGGPCALVTLTQWKLFKKTGYYGLPFWVIQGTRGGHKFQFNQQEQELLRLQDLPGEPARVGQLPYAPFDGRVTQQIIHYNRLIANSLTLEQYRRQMGPEYEAYKASNAKKMRADYVAFLDEQMKDVNDLFITAARKGQLDDGPKTEIDWDRVEQESTPHFIETGHQLHPSMVK